MPSLHEAGWSLAHDAALRGDADALRSAIDGGVALDATLTLGVLGSAFVGGQLVRPKGKTVYPAQLARVDGPAELAFDAGCTPLHVAAWAGHRALVELLLSLRDAGRGVKVDVRDGVGATALHHAARGTARRGATKGAQLEVAVSLLGHGAEPDTAVKSAKSVAFFDEGVTPLHVALEGGHVELARHLTSAGADPGATTANGNTAVFFAARSGDVAALAFLREAGVPLTPPHGYLDDPLLEATTRGHLAMVRALVEAGTAPRDTVLREATAKGHDELRAYLLSVGLPPLTYRTPADAARANDPWALEAMRARGVDITPPAVITNAIAVGNARVVDYLLAHGAQLVTERGTAGPLHMAVEHGHAEIALRVMAHGAPLDARDAAANTPLFVASMRRGMERVLEAMIAAGQNPHEVMRHGGSAWKVTESSPAYRAILGKTTHLPDPSARGWEPPASSRVLNDPAARTTFQKTYQALFEELVPPKGEAPTVQGELVRVSHRLWDEAMRNGNGNFGDRHRAWAEVLEVICGPPFEPLRVRQIREAVRAVAKGTLDDDLHRRVAHAVVEWCVANPELIPRVKGTGA